MQILYLARDLYKEFIKNSYNSAKKAKPIKDDQRILTFPQRRYTNDQQAHEKMTTLLVIREMKSKPQQYDPHLLGKL